MGGRTKKKSCWLGSDCWGQQWHPTPVLLPGKSHGWRSLEGCSPWGRWGSDTTERLHFHFSFLCIGEGNGNPLQCSCLENPRDGGAWWAATYGVAQSRTRLKWLSSSWGKTCGFAHKLESYLLTNTNYSATANQIIHGWDQKVQESGTLFWTHFRRLGYLWSSLVICYCKTRIFIYVSSEADTGIGKWPFKGKKKKGRNDKGVVFKTPKAKLNIKFDIWYSYYIKMIFKL